MKDFVTLILATIGTVLGCINTFHLIDSRRVRMRVVPKSATPERGGVWTNSTEHMSDGTVCIEVVNLSSFPAGGPYVAFLAWVAPTSPFMSATVKKPEQATDRTR